MLAIKDENSMKAFSWIEEASSSVAVQRHVAEPCAAPFSREHHESDGLAG